MRAAFIALALLTTTLIAAPSASAWGCQNFANGAPRAVCEAATGDGGDALREEVDDQVHEANDLIDRAQCILEPSRC